MDITSNLCFTNLSTSLTDQEFRAELLRIFPKAFAGPAENGELVVRLYHAKGVQMKGTVHGFVCSFNEICEIARTNQIKGRKIVVHQDNGDPRDEYGEFMNPHAVQY